MATDAAVSPTHLGLKSLVLAFPDAAARQSVAGGEEGGGKGGEGQLSPLPPEHTIYRTLLTSC